MDWLFIIIGFICIFIGLLGAVLPLPGPPLSFIGLLILNQSRNIELSSNLLWMIGIFTAAISVIDYLLPIWGAKKFGGSKYGTWGASIGMLIGLFLGPLGIFIGAFVGSFVGEMTQSPNKNAAFRAAFGSFVGIMTGIVLKTGLCGYMLYLAIKSVYHILSKSSGL